MPKKGPLFVACNHVNAFIDPLMVGKYHSGNFWFVARGDAFKNKTAAWWLNKMHILPIHRKEDDADSTIKNEGAMRNIINKMVSGERVIIYPEGICVQERRLRKLRKGTARMAFTAEEDANFKLNSKIICAGLNYNRPNQFGADIDIVYGTPFDVSEYEDLYKADANKAMIALTQRMQNELSDLMLIVNDKQDDELFNILDEMLIEDLAKKEQITKAELERKFKLRKNLATRINNLADKHTDKAIELREYAKKYCSLLKQNNLRDWVIKTKNEFGILQLCLFIFTFSITLPLFLFGLVHHYFQYIGAYKLAKKAAKNVEFFSSVNYNAGMFLVLISYMLFFSIALAIGGFSYCTLAYILLVPISGIFTHFFSIYLKKFRGRLRFNSIKNTTTAKQIIEARNVLKNNALDYLDYTR